MSHNRDRATFKPGGRYPYMLQQWFDQSVGDSRYNALQVTVNKRTSHGVTFLVAYTLSHSNDDGCGLGYSECHSTNPYNRKGDYGTSDLNQTNAFSAAFVLQSPFTSLRKGRSPFWLADGRSMALARSVPVSLTRSGPAATPRTLDTRVTSTRNE